MIRVINMNIEQIVQEKALQSDLKVFAKLVKKAEKRELENILKLFEAETGKSRSVLFDYMLNVAVWGEAGKPEEKEIKKDVITVDSRQALQYDLKGVKFGRANKDHSGSISGTIERKVKRTGDNKGTVKISGKTLNVSQSVYGDWILD